MVVALLEMFACWERVPGGGGLEQPGAQHLLLLCVQARAKSGLTEVRPRVVRPKPRARRPVQELGRWASQPGLQGLPGWFRVEYLWTGAGCSSLRCHRRPGVARRLHWCP